MICTFFGHRDTPTDIRPELERTIRELIEQAGVTMFYVGHQGTFDAMAGSLLAQLQEEYAQMEYAIVLPYLYTSEDQLPYLVQRGAPSVFPEGLEHVPPRFAIARRNRWMVEQADIVVAYVRYTWGGAHQFRELARKKGKRIMDLAP